MKIFDNTGSRGGSGSGGIAGEPGDIIFSYNYKTDPKLADITYQSFKGRYEDYPELNQLIVQNPATLSGLPVTDYIDNSLLPYPCELYDFGDFFYATGKNLFNSNEFFINKIFKTPTDNQYNIITLPYAASTARAIFDGTDTFYIFNQPTDNSLITSAIKYNIETLEQETLTLSAKRIIKAYWATDIQKFVVYEMNAIDEDDHDATKNGIFYYDNFDDVKTVPDIVIDKYKIVDININTYIGLVKNCVLRKTDGQIVYIDQEDKKLKDLLTDAEICSFVGDDGTITNITNFTSIFETFGKLFFSFQDTKDSVGYIAHACYSPADGILMYANTYDMPTYETNFLIFNYVYNLDFELGNPFGPAVIYTNASQVRKAVTFSVDKEKQFTFENINTLEAPTSTAVIQFSYMKNDYYSSYTRENTTNEFDDKYMIYDMYGFMNAITYSILDIGFNGLGVSFIYVPAYKLDNLITYLIIKK